MRSALAVAASRRAGRQRATSLSTVPPASTSNDYLPGLAGVAASIIYKSPLAAPSGRPVFILNAAAFPDAFDVDYDTLLSYVLARLPEEDELLSGTEYEIVFFAGGQPDGATTEKKQGPGLGWYIQAYHVLSRATRKKLQRLYIVHPRTWVRVLLGMFGTIVSPKFRRKIVHVNTLSALAQHLQVEKLLIPPSVYLQDRKAEQEIYVPYASGRRAFGVRLPLPKNMNTGISRLPRILRETTSFLLMPANIITEGIFRIPPHATLSNVLKEAYDRGQRFIVWKERGAVLVEPEMDQTLLDEIRIEDAYSVHLAASLIKQWYRELKEPIFPESSYAQLKERYGSPGVQITPEDLVNLTLPMSESSPLPGTSRAILTRHLLPLLSEVAAHEAKNKMNAENLSILFSMCLVCGSNQMDDARVSQIVKKILQKGIEIWPQLRDGMNLPRTTFMDELQPPADSRDYEDPLEEERTRPRNVSQTPPFDKDSEEHRIVLQDSDEAPASSPAELGQGFLGFEQSVSALPRTPIDTFSEPSPPLPPRPSAMPTDARPSLLRTNIPPPVPKRKPAPTSAVDPPRYSEIFDNEGNSVHLGDSPASYVPVNGFGPPRRSDWSYDEELKQGFPSPPIDRHPALNMPKRKAVSGEHKPSDSFPANSSETSPIEASAAAGVAAQKAATTLAQQAAAAASAIRSSTDPSPIDNADNSSDKPEPIFRKPSWPASARPAMSLNKSSAPAHSPRPLPASAGSFGNGHSFAVPKPRAPSPGILQRMTSMELEGSAGSAGPEKSSLLSEPPRRLDLRKTSVEDLRRLYEERVSAAHSLAEAEKVKRSLSRSREDVRTEEV